MGRGGFDLLIARIMGQSGPTVLEALGAQRPTFRGTGLEMTVVVYRKAVRET